MKFFTTKAHAAEKARADAAEELAKLNAEDKARLRVEIAALEAKLAKMTSGLRQNRKPVLEMVA